MRTLVAIALVAAPAPARAGGYLEPSGWLGAGLAGEYKLTSTLRVAGGYRHRFGDDGADLRIGLAFSIAALSRLDGGDDAWKFGLVVEGSLDWPISESWRLGPWLGVEGNVGEPLAAGVRARWADLMLGADVATGFPGDGTRFELGVGAAPRRGHVLVTAEVCAGFAAIALFGLYLAAPHGH